MNRGFAWAKTLLSIPLQEARRVQGTSKIILDSVCNPNALFYFIEYFNNSNPRYESLSFPVLIYKLV